MIINGQQTEEPSQYSNIKQSHKPSKNSISKYRISFLVWYYFDATFAILSMFLSSVLYVGIFVCSYLSKTEIAEVRMIMMVLKILFGVSEWLWSDKMMLEILIDQSFSLSSLYGSCKPGILMFWEDVKHEMSDIQEFSNHKTWICLISLFLSFLGSNKP